MSGRYGCAHCGGSGFITKTCPQCNGYRLIGRACPDCVCGKSRSDGTTCSR